MKPMRYNWLYICVCAGIYGENHPTVRFMIWCNTITAPAV